MAQLLGAVARQGNADDVNAWAKEATRGLVPQAVAPGTRFDMLLANAVYFKGQWERGFDKNDTIKEADFRALKLLAPSGPSSPKKAGSGGGNSSSSSPTKQAAAAALADLAYSPKKVQMMQMRLKAQDDRNLLRAKQRGPLVMLTSQFIAVRLPYKGGRQSAVLVQPLDDSPGPCALF